jgi:hypothetical protein
MKKSYRILRAFSHFIVPSKNYDGHTWVIVINFVNFKCIYYFIFILVLNYLQQDWLVNFQYVYYLQFYVHLGLESPLDER